MTEREPPRQFGADGLDPEALARYLSGESSLDEAEAVRTWLEQYPEQARMVQALDGAVATMARSAPALDVEAALAKVHARIASDGVRPLRRSRWSTYAGLAAAAGIVLAITGYLMRADLINWKAALPGGRPNHATVYASFDHMRTLRLSDGTVALMAPNSFVQVSGDYNRGNRAIEAEGLVRFEVHHNAHVPFVVNVGPATITDVGTTFVIRSFRDSLPDSPHHMASVTHVVVAVTRGEVRLASRDTTSSRPVELRAGERGTKIVHSPAERLAGSISPADTSWTHGELIFKDTPMAAVAVELSRWYGVDLRIGDSTLARRRLTATFNGFDSVTRVLSAVSLAVDGQVVGGQGEAHPRVFSLVPNSTH